jgi:hypothetical protein
MFGSVTALLLITKSLQIMVAVAEGVCTVFDAAVTLTRKRIRKRSVK